jgi:hypothetical protein
MTFDTVSYQRLSAKLDIEDIDFDSFRDHPLPPQALRCLRYMHDVENHTVCYLRDVLVTRAHRDPEVTSFLTLWNYEEFWHGEAIAGILEAHDEQAGTTRIAALRQRLPKRDAWRPLTFQLASAITPHLTAVHMTWGAVNEWTTQAAYARLSKLADHPALTEILRRIMKQEGRHIDFYSTQAKSRLADSRAAQRLTRWALRRFWAPVGTGVVPDQEVDFLRRYLFGDDDGRAVADRIDRRVDRLPGLDGLYLLRGAVSTAA